MYDDDRIKAQHYKAIQRKYNLPPIMDSAARMGVYLKVTRSDVPFDPSVPYFPFNLELVPHLEIAIKTEPEAEQIEVSFSRMFLKVDRATGEVVIENYDPEDKAN